jgi:hypothetical protein
MLTIGKKDFETIETKIGLHFCFALVNSLQSTNLRLRAILVAWKYFLP